jgi:hypothetical protein
VGLTELVLLSATTLWTYVVVLGVGRLWRGRRPGRATLNAVLPQTEESTMRLTRAGPVGLSMSLSFLFLASAVSVESSGHGRGWIEPLSWVFGATFLVTFNLTLTTYFLGAPRWVIPPLSRDRETDENGDLSRR